MLTCTPRLGDYQPTRGPKRLAQPDRSDANLDESSSTPSLKGMDLDKASFSSLLLPIEEVINQVGDSVKVSKYISLKYLPEFMLDVIRAPEGQTQEVSTPYQVASWQYVRWRQQRRHLTNSEPNHNPMGSPIRVPSSSDPGFGDSSGYPSGSYSDKPTKDPSPLPIIKPASVAIKTPTNDSSHVSN